MMLKKQMIWSILFWGWLCTACQTPPPPFSPTPAEIKVNQFSATPLSLAENEEIMVNWDVSGVQNVHLTFSYFSEPRHINFDEVHPPAGSATLVVPKGVQTAKLILWVRENQWGENLVEEEISLTIGCQFAWFAVVAEPYCPESDPQEVAAVYQSFEKGYIIYRPDIQRLWVYHGQPNSFYSFPEHIFPTDPNSPYFSHIEFNETPPAGLEQPVGLIGRAWLPEHTRNSLGWATAPEQNYTMQVQKTPWAVGTKGQSFILFTLPTNGTITTMLD